MIAFKFYQAKKDVGIQFEICHHKPKKGVWHSEKALAL